MCLQWLPVFMCSTAGTNTSVKERQDIFVLNLTTIIELILAHNRDYKKPDSCLDHALKRMHLVIVGKLAYIHFSLLLFTPLSVHLVDFRRRPPSVQCDTTGWEIHNTNVTLSVKLYIRLECWQDNKRLLSTRRAMLRD